jgi:hypothetical protein
MYRVAPLVELHASRTVVLGIYMKSSLRILSKKGVSLFHFSGEMTIADGRQAFVEYVNHEEFDPAYVMITDARGVTSIEATFKGVLSAVFGLAGLIKKFRSGAKSVILVQDPSQFGYARMLEQILDYSSPIRVQIALCEEEALSLADRPEVSFAELLGEEQ